ncbi:hypothetical protein ACVPPR_04205 [Dellaglioa sp. L3N]
MTTINLSKNSFGNSIQFKSSHSIIQFDSASLPNNEVDALLLTHFSVAIHERLLKSNPNPTLPIYLSKEAFELKQQLVLLGKISKTDLNYKIIPVSVPLTIDDFTITAFLSDSIYTGSLAFLIEDNKHKRAFFTGDTRLNGPHKKRTKKWIHSVNQLPLDIIILDVPYEIDVNDYTETTILDHLNKLLSVPALTCLNVSVENLHLIHGLTTLAKKLEKTVVLNPDLNRLLTYFYPDTEVLSLNAETTLAVKNEPDKYILVTTKNMAVPFNITAKNQYSLLDFLEHSKNINELPINSHLSPSDIHELLNRLANNPKQLIVIDPFFKDNSVTY